MEGETQRDKHTRKEKEEANGRLELDTKRRRAATAGLIKGSHERGNIHRRGLQPNRLFVGLVYSSYFYLPADSSEFGLKIHLLGGVAGVCRQKPAVQN